MQHKVSIYIQEPPQDLPVPDCL